MFFCASSLSDAKQEPRSAPPYRRVNTLLLAYGRKRAGKHTWLPLLTSPHLPASLPACLAVKWLCSGHAQFVSFHPGLMSDSTQGLSAPFGAPPHPPPPGQRSSSSSSSTTRLLVCFCSVLCEEMALSPHSHARACLRACTPTRTVCHSYEQEAITRR